jgi:hypothetical protein
MISATLIAALAGCANNKSTPCTTEPSTQPACVESEVADIDAQENRHPMERQSDRMIHNAELADMVIADIHFLPHRDGLNATGTQRLNHLAWLVEKYGGTIKMDMKEPKSELTQTRLKTVQDYLRTWGLPDNKIKVEVGLSENEGMDAKEGIDVYNQSRSKKEEKMDLK